MIQHYANPMSQKFDGKVYQIFGFDILLDQNLKAWVLEINDHPSLNIVMCKVPMGCRHLDCPVSNVDLVVKKEVIGDLYQIMRNNNQVEDRFMSYSRIFPLKKSADERVYGEFKKLRNFFYGLCNSKDGLNSLSAASFEKLTKNKILAGYAIKRIDLTILF